MKWRWLYAFFTLAFVLGTVGVIRPNTVLASIDCTTYPTSLNGRCLNQSYFSGLDFGSSIANGGYGSTGVWANAGTANAGNSCFSFQNTDADITGSQMCGLWSYTDSMGSDGLDEWAFPDTIDNGKSGAAQAFVNFIGDYLNYTQAGCNFNSEFAQPSYSFTTYDSCAFYRARILGAAYIVLTMVGGQYTTYDVGNLFAGQVNGSSGPFNNIQAGIQDARNEYSTWSQEVLQADAVGDVNWDTNTPNSISFNNHPNTSAVDYNHDVEMREEAPQPRHSIIFNTPTGQYVINRRCGNTDSFSALAPAAPTPAPTPVPTPTPPAPGPAGAGGEVIIMNPSLYLNPPFGLDDTVDSPNGALNGQGERPPLF